MMRSVFKHSVTFLLLIVMVFSLSFNTFASSVTYDDNSKDFIFSTESKENPTDLFENFKNAMPGDTLNQKITVNNKASEKVKIRVYLRSTGAEEGSAEFLSKLNLKVAQDGNSTLFDAPADQTAGLTDWVCLGTFESGAKVDLNLDLQVPITLGNDFQNAVGKLDWQFKVEEFPIEEETPKTGEFTNLWIFVLLMFVSAGSIAVILIAKKRSQKDEA